MAVSDENSTQYANSIALPNVKTPTYDWHGRLRIMRFDFTQAVTGDAGSVATLGTLPAGNVRVILSLSRIAFSAYGASRTMDLGWLAHVDQAGDAVVVDQNGLDDGVDVSGAGSVIPGGTVGGDETVLFSSQTGVQLTAAILDGTAVAANTLNGYFVYLLD